MPYKYIDPGKADRIAWCDRSGSYRTGCFEVVAGGIILLCLVRILMRGCGGKEAEEAADFSIGTVAGFSINCLGGYEIGNLAVTANGFMMLFLVGMMLRMDMIKKAFCIAGIIAGVFLCFFSWITSVEGIRYLLGPGTNGVMSVFLPFALGTLAIAFNALSGTIFAILATTDEGSFNFTTVCTGLLWIGFLCYDALSSFVGVLSNYSGMKVTTWEIMISATEKLGPVATGATIIVSALLALAPFVTSLFGGLLSGGSRA